MAKKHYIEIKSTSGIVLGTFCIEDNPQTSFICEDEKYFQARVPIDWAVACVKQAGYRVFKEI